MNLLPTYDRFVSWMGWLRGSGMSCMMRSIWIVRLIRGVGVTSIHVWMLILVRFLVMSWMRGGLIPIWLMMGISWFWFSMVDGWMGTDCSWFCMVSWFMRMNWGGLYMISRLMMWVNWSLIYV